MSKFNMKLFNGLNKRLEVLWKEEEALFDRKLPWIMNPKYEGPHKILSFPKEELQNCNETIKTLEALHKLVAPNEPPLSAKQEPVQLETKDIIQEAEEIFNS